MARTCTNCGGPMGIFQTKCPYCGCGGLPAIFQQAKLNVPTSTEKISKKANKARMGFLDRWFAKADTNGANFLWYRLPLIFVGVGVLAATGANRTVLNTLLGIFLAVSGLGETKWACFVGSILWILGVLAIIGMLIMLLLPSSFF